MEFTTLGRTGLRVSVAGLGCGGHSRLGTAHGASQKKAAELVSFALDQGVNFIDTAAAYGTEPAVGMALQGRRESAVISTKAAASGRDGMRPVSDIVASLDNSLVQLKTDYIDVFNVHGVTMLDVDHVLQEVVPELKRQQQMGKIRHLGVTEAFIRDPGHKMLQHVLPEDIFDVAMVGFNLLNPSARRLVFPLTQKHNVATQIMFAVRRALSQPDALVELVAELLEQAVVTGVDRNDPLGFVAAHPQVRSVVEAAYRFCRYEPGATVVLTGTGSADHLAENLASIMAPPLPQELLEQLEDLFGDVDSVSGN
jgi:L-galactose dehydrogenase